MEFYDVIRTRRSIRSYKPRPISDEVLNKVLEAFRLAPSGSNRQPWKLIIVKDEKKRSQLVSACADQQFIGEAPIIIVACGQKINYNRGGYMGDMSMIMDVSIAFTHLILAARVEGLGTCWIGAFNNNDVKEILHIPNGMDVVAITPLGYPENAEFVASNNRKALTEIVSINSACAK